MRTPLIEPTRLTAIEISRKMLEGLNTTARTVFDYLAGKGYQCHAITEDGRIGGRTTDSAAFYENYLALADPAAGPRGWRGRRENASPAIRLPRKVPDGAHYGTIRSPKIPNTV